MTAIAADSYDLRRWVLSAAVVIGLHAALVVRLTTWHERLPGDEGTEAIIVDLAPLTAPPTDSRNDLAPGPEQQQSKSAQDVQQPEQTPQEKIEPPPPVPDAEVKLPEEVKPAEKPKEEPTPPVPETTSPPRPRPSAAQVASWHRRIAQQVERHKGYPAFARARHETGTARTRLHARSQRKGCYEPHRADVGICGSRSGNDRYRAACAALPVAAAEHAR